MLFTVQEQLCDLLYSDNRFIQRQLYSRAYVGLQILLYYKNITTGFFYNFTCHTNE